MVNPIGFIAMARFFHTGHLWALVCAIAVTPITSLLRTVCGTVAQFRDLRGAVDDFHARFDRFELERIDVSALVSAQAREFLRWPRPQVQYVKGDDVTDLSSASYNVFLVRMREGPLVAQLKAFVTDIGDCSVFLRDRPTVEKPHSLFKLYHELGHLTSWASQRWSEQFSAGPLALLTVLVSFLLVRELNPIMLGGVLVLLIERCLLSKREAVADLEAAADTFALAELTNAGAKATARVVRSIHKVWVAELAARMRGTQRYVLRKRLRYLERNIVAMARRQPLVTLSSPEHSFSLRNVAYAALLSYCAIVGRGEVFGPYFLGCIALAAIAAGVVRRRYEYLLYRQGTRAKLYLAMPLISEMPSHARAHYAKQFFDVFRE